MGQVTALFCLRTRRMRASKLRAAKAAPAPAMVTASMRIEPPAPAPYEPCAPFARTLPSRASDPAAMRTTPPPALHGLQVALLYWPPAAPGSVGSKSESYVAPESPYAS